MPAKKGLYANIKAKKDRIAHGSGEKMRKAGSPGAPKAGAFERAAKTARKKPAAKGMETTRARLANKAPAKKPASTRRKGPAARSQKKK